jgi:hypothetical protein
MPRLHLLSFPFQQLLLLLLLLLLPLLTERNANDCDS